MSYSTHGVTVETISGVTILRPHGALKLGETVLDELRGRCCELAARPVDRLVLDLEEVPYIDSSGIGVLIHAYTSMHSRGRRCKLLRLGPAPAEVLRVVRLLGLFEVYHDRNAVLASFEQPAHAAGMGGGPERAA